MCERVQFPASQQVPKKRTFDCTVHRAETNGKTKQTVKRRTETYLSNRLGEKLKEINLTMGKIALVDDDDFEYLNQWKWFAVKHRNTFYAQRKRKLADGPGSKTIHMHRVVMHSPETVLVDHQDRNGLNNQKYNLRNCNTNQNQYNRGVASHNKSGYKGVAWNKWANKYRVQIRVENKQIHVGYFEDPIEAAKAYDEAAKKFHGKFAKTNF